LAAGGRHAGVHDLAAGMAGASDSGCFGRATLLATSAELFLRNPDVHEEVFGPAGVIVRCRNEVELHDAVKALRGQLTAGIHCAAGELDDHGDLVELLTARAGRVLVNGFPTGVEVCDAMVHGGPFPASTDSRFTSVGTNAVKRFLRPVCYQNFPEALLPAALRDANPWGINRLVDGALTRAAY
jgi:NADP-dependent aldehyde dehydrogenase